MNKATQKPEDVHFDQLLKAKKLRATPIRKRILKTLALAKQPLSVEELFTRIQGKDKNSLDLVTLYRNVSAFKEAELVVSIDLGVGKIFYEYTGGGRSHHHHHIVCQHCEKIEHLEVCGLELHFKMLETMGYKNLRHNLEFSGLCKSCQ